MKSGRKWEVWRERKGTINKTISLISFISLFIYHILSSSPVHPVSGDLDHMCYYVCIF